MDEFNQEYNFFYKERIAPYDLFLRKDYFRGSYYHYTGINALESILKNRTLHLTRVDFLNDSKEISHSLELLKKIYKNNQNWRALDEKAFSFVFIHVKKWVNNSYVLSLSKNPDSLALWGIYSKFEGYNFKINLNDLYHNNFFEEKVSIASKSVLKPKRYFQRKDADFSYMSGDISYDSAYQEDYFLRVLSSIDELLEKYSPFNHSANSKFMFDFEILVNSISYNVQLFKNPSFIQEEEHRLIVNFKKGATKNYVKYRPLNGAFIPYIEIGFENKIPIESISIGPRNGIDIAEKGLKAFLISLSYKVGNKDGCLKTIKSNIPLRY